MKRHLVGAAGVLLVVTACGQGADPNRLQAQLQSASSSSAPRGATVASRPLPPPPPSFGPQARTLPEGNVVVEPLAATDAAVIGRAEAEQLALETNFDRDVPTVSLARVTVVDYYGTHMGGPLSRFIDKRLSWVFEYPWRAGRLENDIAPIDLDPSYVPPTKIAAQRSLVLIDAMTGRVLLLTHGAAR